MGVLSDDEIREGLDGLPGWELREGRLVCDWVFPGFSEAWAFLSRVALAAEKADHHPDWANRWNRVSVELVTHSEGGITHRDLAMAAEMSALAAAEGADRGGPLSCHG